MKGRRFLAMLMSLVMLCMNFSSVVPMFAFAEEAPAAQQNEAVAAEPVVVEPAPQLAAEPEPQPAENSAEQPTEAPAEEPTEAPAEEPTEAPAEEPTEAPAEEPTEAPAEEPTEAPAEEPTEAPAEEPTEAPAEEPTEAPAEEPTEAPTAAPTEAPTAAPTEEPTPEPTEVPFALGKLSASKTEATVGETIAFSFDVTGAESVTWSVSRGSEILAAGEAWNGSFTWQAAISGAFTVTVKATKGDQTLEQNIGVTVREGELKAAVSSSALYGVVNEKAIDFTVAISGGVQPWSVSYAVETDGATVFTADNLSSYDNISYMPTAFGATKLVLTVVDAAGASVTAASNVIPVAVNERETASQWEATLPRLTADMTEIDRLVAVAKSQLGYRENARNFIIEQNGERQTYTRYGEWIGEPYGEYSAKFVSFVLKYAGLEFNPRSQTAKKLKSALGSRYVDDEDHYTPNVGDLIFLKVDRDNEDPNQVGIVTAVSGSSVTAIEGVYGDSVRENSYSLTDTKIVGYGDMHAVLGLATEEAQADAGKPAVTLTQTMSDGTVITAEIPEGALPEGIEMRAVTTDVNAAAVKVLTKNGYTQAEAEAAVQELVAQGVNLGDYVAAYDISFRMPYAPEVEIEPEKPVTVSFSKVAIQAESGSEVEVYHVDDNGRVDVVDSDAGVSGSGVDATVATDAFSEIITSNPNGLLGLLGAGRGEDDGNAPDPSNYNTPSEYVNAAYGNENDEDNYKQIWVEVTGEPGETVKAGDTINSYYIRYGWNNPLDWAKGLPSAQPLFDQYIDNTVQIKLPAGLLLTSVGGHSFDKSPNNTDPDTEHTYTIHLPNKNAAEAYSGFSISVFVCNNGTEDALATYGTDNGEGGFNIANAVSFSTTFTTLDKTVTPHTEIGTYTQTVKADMKGFKTITEDKWGVEKTLQSAELSPNNDKVTFTWAIDVGMLNSNGKVMKSPSDYNIHGRDPVEEMKIIDTFLTNLVKGENDEVPKNSPSNVTIQKDGGTAQSYSSGTEIRLNGTLKLNQEIKVDTDSDTVGDQLVDTYTKYIVTVTYDVTSDMIAPFYENKHYTLDSDNEALLSEYKLVNLNAVTSDEPVSAEGSVALPVTEPAKLTINKQLKNYLGAVGDYSGKYGDIAYTLTAATPFTVYKYENDEYTAYEGMENVTSATLHDIFATEDANKNSGYYLVAGTAYTVTEALSTDQQGFMTLFESSDTVKTPAEGDDWIAKFTNRETLGQITVQKKDDWGSNLGGAIFELYDSNNQPVVIGKTEDGDDITEKPTSVAGVALFDNLRYGSYTLKEKSAPDGYALGTTTEWTVTIGDDNQDVKLDIVNKKSTAQIQLTKYLGVTEATITNKANSNYPGTFVLQRTTTPNVESSWTNVTISTNKVGDNGSINANVDAFAADGTAYSYRFVETIPAGFYDADTGATDTATSQVVTLVVDGKAAQNIVNVDMRNRKMVRTNVTKNFYPVKTNGQTNSVDQNKTTTVKLYSYTKSDYSDLAQVTGTDSQTIGRVNNVSQYARWTNLPYYGPDGNGNMVRIHYVVKEEAVDTYLLDRTQTGNTVKIGDEYYVELTGSASGNAGTSTAPAADGSDLPALSDKTLYNVQQAIPVQIWKRNYYTNDPIDGAGVTIYNADGTIAHDAISGAELKDVPVKTGSSFNVTVYLEPGKSYTFAETVNNTGLNYHSVSNSGKIDLTSVSQTYANRGNTKSQTRTIYNAPDPLIRINKVSSANTGTSVSGAQFTVYTKDGNVYKPVKDDQGNPIVITTTNANSTTRLPKGEYYFAETTVPEGYLDPNTNLAFYQSLSSDYVSGTTSDGQTLTFIKGTVEDMKKNGTSDNIMTFTFKNIPNVGSLAVKKTIDGTAATIAGFNVQVKNAAGEVVATKATDPNGNVTFDNLPVYDANGNKIQYTITEALTESQAEVYYKASDDQTAELSIDATKVVVTSKDTSGNDLVINNASRVQWNGTKVYVDSWEYAFTQLVYRMQGATIGLFKQVGDNWVLVDASELKGSSNPQTTDENGRVHFDGLRRDTNYVMVELASGNSAYFPRINGTVKDDGYPADGVNTTTIPNSAINNYNHLSLTSETMSDTADKIFGDGDSDRPLYNANHWVQFHIKKWLDADTFDRSKGEAPIYGDAVDFDADKPLNNSVFWLYRYEMPEGQTSVNFNPTSPAPWEKIGEYTTGTLYNTSDEVQNGEFITKVESNITKNYVYMLVEHYPGLNGVEINPKFKYIFWHAYGTQYTASVTGSEYVRSNIYQMDTVNHDDVLNAHPVGPGETKYYLASVRISKWQDSFDMTNGLPKKDYQPLPNAKFELRLTDGTVIATLISGLAAQNGGTQYSAQSGTFQLKITTNGDGTKSYQLVDYESDKSYGTVDVEEFTATYNGTEYPGYRIRTKLVETEAPAGYSYISEGYDMWLCFLDTRPENTTGECWVYNDAYYVRTSGKNTTEKLAENQSGTSWYLTNAGEGSFGTAGDGQTPLRIVDYPITNTIVRVEKFGYKPNAATQGLTSTQLDEKTKEEIEREPLEGVEMVIERKNTEGVFEAWDYLKDDWGTRTFSTNSEGSYIFPLGLPEGVYRVYEKSMPDRYATTYEMAYSSASKARVFTVTKAAATITMYNPKMVSFQLKKEDMSDNALEGVKFTLTSKTTGIGNKEGTTGADGTVTIMDIPTAKYVLTETDKTGYASNYFTKYIAEQYPDLAALTGSTGLDIGYTYQVSGDADSEADYIVKTINPQSNSAPLLSLTIKNPQTGSIGLKKVDADQADTGLQGANFMSWYKPFDATSGTMDFTGKVPTTRAYLNNTANGWTRRSDATTRADGTIATLTNLNPGVYAFIESSAPTGYDRLTTTDGNEIIFFVVVKGDMKITVTGLPTKAATWLGDVDTYYEGTTGTISFVLKNAKRVELKAKKTVNYNELASVTGISKAWSVTLNLYDENKTTLVGTLTLTNSTNQGEDGVTFKESASSNRAALFSPGKTYYLKEVMNNPTSGFAINMVMKDGTEVAASNGFYPFPIGGFEGFTIDVTNDYLWGYVKFDKRDETTLELIPGAKFKVCANRNGAWVKIADVSPVTITQDGETKETGTYYAYFPLEKAEETEYRIYETSAPDPYLTDESKFISVTLSAENNVEDYSGKLEDPDKYITNTEGYKITVQKYNNMHSASANLYPAGTNDAKFKFYHQTTEGWEEMKEVATDGDGKAIYLTTPGQAYAVAESYFDATKYTGLDGVYDKAGNKLTPTEITVGGETIDAFVFENVTAAIDLFAYNKPLIAPKIVKKDVGGYPANVIPNASFEIYEVAADFVANDKTVKELLDGDQTPVYSGTTSRVEGTTTTHEWKDLVNLDKNWDPSKTYLIVETNVGSSSSGKTYNTLNKDDDRVVWYVKTEAVADPKADNAPVYTLENVYGEAKVSLTKNVVNNTTAGITTVTAADTDNAVVGGKVETLLSGERKVVYTLEPRVEGANQPLTSFVLKDMGISFAPESTTGPQPSYKITKVNVGKASHNTENFDEALYGTIANAAISAKITFSNADGTTEEQIIDDISAAKDVEPASNTVVSFEIEYYSKPVDTATEGVYKLGSDFNVGMSTVYVTVNKLPDGEVGNAVTEITDFTNTSKAILSYPTWSSSGVRGKPADKTATDDAVVSVNTTKLPRVKVVKLSYPGDGIQTGGNIRYTIEVTNIGTPASAEADFIDPVVLDILPTGVIFAGNVEVSSGTANETFTLKGGEPEQFTGKATQQIVTESGSVEYGDSETAVVFNLSGTLQPKSKFTIKFDATVTETAVLYGSRLENDVFLSSSKHTYHTTSNENGYSFYNDIGNFPGTLPGEASALSALAGVRESQGLHEELGAYADADAATYIWVKSKSEITVNTSETITLKKGVMGDLDDGYIESAEQIGYCSRTDSLNTEVNPHNPGYADWQLSIINGNEEERSWMVVGDVIPKVGDGRDTVWNMSMDSITAVEVNGQAISASDYFVYYYTGDIAGATSAVESAMRASNDWSEDSTNPAWPRSGSTLLSGWQKADDVTDMSSVTAFLIVFDSDIVLLKDSSMVIIYRTLVDSLTNQEFEQVQLQNACNNYKFFSVGAPKILTSNKVFVTLLDGLVEVEGDVWIDEDWDATQKPKNTTEARRDYSEYKVVQNLVNAIKFTLTNYHGEDRPTTNTNDVTGENNELGETIRHFMFEELAPAQFLGAPQVEYINSELNVNSLKPSKADNFVVNAMIDGNYSYLKDIFKLTDTGAESYISDDPDHMPDAHALDNNFSANDDSGLHFVTKRFYLRYSERNDESKDIGFKMVRELELTKIAQDDPAIKIEDAEFEIYGPFDEDTATGATGDKLTFNEVSYAYVEDGTGSTTTLKTNAQGKLLVTGLNWWKEYVIKESKAAPGYSIKGATATADASVYTAIENTDEDGVFVLKLPGKDKVTKTDKVTVADPRKVDVVLNVEKLFNSLSKKAFKFKFDLKLTDEGLSDTLKTLNAELLEKDPIQTVTISNVTTTNGTATRQASYDAVTLNGVGTYIFTITEQTGTTGTGDAVTYGTNLEEDANLTITATVVVTWDATAKKLVADVEYSVPNDAETHALFENEYDATGTWKPTITKVLTGRTLEAEEFEFEVVDAENNVLFRGKNAADGTVALTGDPIQYTLEDVGTHTYTIREKNEQAADADGDGNPDDGLIIAAAQTVTVTVSEGATPDGKLVVTPPTADAKYTFTNEYHAKGDWTTTASKVLTGRALKAGEFTFVLEQGTVDAEGKFTATTGTRVTATNDVNGNVNFDKTYNYTEAQVGDHYYRITEASGSLDGITYDTTEYIIKVTVSAVKGSDKLSVVATRNNAPFVDAEFNNTYDTKPTSFILEVKKTVTGPVPANDDTEFTFTLTPNSGNGSGCSMTGPATVTVKGNEVKRFPAINFTAAGKYYFELQETDGRKPGWTYDTAAKAIEIHVEDVNSQLTITKIVGATEIVDPTTDDTVGQVEVVNPYTQTETGMTVRVQKTVTGDPRPGAEENFEFTLTAKSTNPTEGCSLAPSAFKTITVAGNATGDFEFIKFTKVGTYEFTLVETDGGKAGYTYDTTPKNIKVVVTDVNSQLTISEFTVDGTNITAEGTTAIFKVPAITNEYHVTPTDYTPDAIKVIEGNDRDENQKKTFTVTLANAANETNDGATIVVNTATAVDEDTFNFVLPTGTPGAIHFTKAGTYTYTLTETVVTGDTVKGYTYDTKSWDIVVTVVDNGSQLQATAQYKQAGTEEWLASATFTNKYEPSPASRQLQVRKKLTGEPLFDAANTVFTFKLSALDGEIANKDGYKLPDTTEITISGTAVEAGGANGATATFDAISFTKAGTYYFLVEEIKGNTSHVTYDSTQWKVEIVVTDNGGTLVAGTPKYINTTTNEEATVAEAVFTNDYTPDTAKYPPKAYKSVDGEPRNNNKLETFTFELTQVSGPNGGATLPANTTVDIIDSGVTAFGNIEFSKAGTYVFEIKEKAGSNTHYKYSLDKWQLTVVVADDEGTLTVTSHNYALIGGDKTSTEQAEFINTYTPDPTAYAPKAKKTISGQTPPAYDEDDTFEFVLTATEVVAGGSYLTSDTEKTPIVANGTWTKTIVGPGVVTFDEFTYIKAGTYKYTIKETKGDTNGYTYSGDVWNLTVTVTDTGDKLERTIQYQLDTTANTEEAEFVNKYEPAPATWTPKVKKVMSDDSRPIVKTAKSFIFKLSLASANPTDGVNLSGELSKTVVLHPGETESAIGEFSQIRFTKAGTYTFTIAEEDGTAPGFAYDTTDKTTATVTISDVKGQLTVASVTYVNTDPRVVVEDNTITATHMNTYIPTPTEYKPSVNKELTTNYGPTVETKTFNFTMVPDANNPDGAVIPENGDKTTLTLEKGDDPTKTADFGTISFNRAGTFRFAITEDIPADELKEEGVTYDQNTWTLTVEVEDLDGELSVKSTSYTNGTDTDTQMAKFTNDYKPDTTKFTPKATKTIKVDFGPTVAKKIFNFTLTLDTAVAKDGTTDVKDGADTADDDMSIEVAAGENVAENFFKKITFSKAGTYTYKIQEQVSDEEGITDDTAEKTLVIVVTDKDGALFIEEYTYTPGAHKKTTADGDVLTGKEEDEDATGATVENIYTPDTTEFTPKVTKTIKVDFGPTVAKKIFNFTLTLDTAVAKDGTTDVKDGADTADDDMSIEVAAGENVAENFFKKITFSKAGTYTYKIQEQVSDEEGITDDTAEKTLVIVVTDKDGALFIEEYTYTPGNHKETTADGDVLTGKEEDEDVTGVTVENIYTPNPTELTPVVTKIVTINNGPLVKAKTFKFTLTPDPENPDGVTYDTHEADGIEGMAGDKTQLTIPAGQTTGSETFGKINFVHAGTYKFYITEDDGDEAGITNYDDAEWTLTIVIRDTDNQLVVESYKYEDDEGNVTDSSKAVFEGDDAGTAEPTDDPTEPPTEPTEEEPAGNSVPKMIKSVEDAKTGAEFTNVYTPTPTEYQPEVEKIVTTAFGPLVEDKIFNFELKLISAIPTEAVVEEPTEAEPAEGEAGAEEPAAGEPEEAAAKDIKDKVTIPEGGDKLQLIVKAGDTTATGEFGNIKFEQAGTYVFEATEVKEKEAGITYSEKVWTLTLLVVDHDGTLKVDEDTYTDDENNTNEDDVAVWTNIYVPEPTSYTPNVKKILETPLDATVAEKTFHFTLDLVEAYDEDGNDISKFSTKATKNEETGETTYTELKHSEATITLSAGEDPTKTEPFEDEFTFTRAGTYVYEVKEKKENENGVIIYDESVWMLIVEVVDDDSKLRVASHDYSGPGIEPDSDEAAAFRNTYVPEPTEYVPVVDKSMTVYNGPTVATKTFSFTMKPASNPNSGATIAQYGDTATVTIPAGQANGQASFGTITFNRTGTYTFEVKENVGAQKGITYDTHTWTLTVVVVSDDAALRVQSATWNRDDGGAVTGNALFINPYNPTPATYAPRAIKTIAGDNPATASTFTFTMTAGTVVADGSHVAGIDGSIVNGTVWTKSVVGAGSVDFDAIEYTKPGTYTYTMVENGGTAGGYTYSTANWTLTVTVTDQDGVLTATPMYTGGGAANTTAATFTNTYTAPPPPPDNVTVNVDGVKIWVDQSDMHGLRPNEITVTLYADGAPVAGATPTWTSTAGDNWTFTFQNLPANNADGTAINYTVTETPVNGYTARISGTTITNTLIPREVENFIDINGTKTWDDGGDTANRPAYITVRLFRDQVEVARQTVTAANNWSYSFTNQPADDGYGHVYTYAVREVTVEGYFQQVAGYNITNRPVPPGTQVRRRPPVENMSEEELEELIELFDYDTPLFGMMGTGDETPLYPFIFGGAGALALVAVLVLGKKRKRNEAA